MNLHRLLRKGLIVSIIFGVAAVAGYLTRLLLARYVSIEDFGLFYAVLTFVMTFSIICDLSFGPVLHVYIPALRKQRLHRKIKGYLLLVFGWQMITRLLVIAVLISLAPIISKYYFKDSATMLIYFFAFAFLLSGFGSFNSGITGFRHFRTAASLNLIRIVSFLLGLYLIFWFRQNVVAAAAAYVFSVLFTDVITFAVFVKKVMPNFFKIKAFITKEMIKSLFSFGFLLTVSSLIIYAIGSVDTLVITYFRPLSELGVYQMALPTATLVTFLIAWPVNLMLPTTLAHLKRAQQKNVIQQIRNLLLLLVVPIVVFFAVFSSDILNILFNQTSDLGAWMLRLLAINQVVFILVQFSISVLTGLKRAKELLRISIITTIILIVLTIIGAKLFGVIGVIEAYLVSFCIFLLLTDKAIHKVCAVKVDWIFTAKVLCIGLITCGIMFGISALEIPKFINLSLAAIVGAAAYVFLATRSGIFKWKLVKRMLRS